MRGLRRRGVRGLHKDDAELRAICKGGVGPATAVAESRAFFELGVAAVMEIWRCQGYGEIDGPPRPLTYSRCSGCSARRPRAARSAS
eukprot:5103919-Pyramimonas_sp.AAC.1